jgi:hypothetical protein
MNTKLKIKTQIFTHLSDRFFRVHLSCKHSYYVDGKCTDLAFELTDTSKALLKANDIYFKENEHSLFIGRKKRDLKQDTSFNSTLTASLPVFIILKIKNRRFWSVTDFNLLKAPQDAFKAESPLVFRYKKGKETISECSNKALTDEEQELLQVKNFSKETFGVLVLDLQTIATDKTNIALKLEAPKIKLKYKVSAPKAKKAKTNGSKHKLTIEDVLANKKVLRECDLKQENRLELKAKKVEGFYLVESANDWPMRQENPHQNPGFFKFEVEIEDSDKANENKAEVLLPFPSKIKPNLFKKEGDLIILEQDVSLFRFGAKS